MSMPNIFTRDIDAAIVFYCDQLGFVQKDRVPGAGRPVHVVLQLGESLLALSAPDAVGSVGLDPTSGNTFELIVWCTDVDQEVARLRAVGVAIVVEPYDHIGGRRRSYLADPDGNWVALVGAS
ncbi:MAG: VOC family protein [Pseudonocardia sp.]